MENTTSHRGKPLYGKIIAIFFLGLGVKDLVFGVSAQPVSAGHLLTGLGLALSAPYYFFHPEIFWVRLGPKRPERDPGDGSTLQWLALVGTVLLFGGLVIRVVAYWNRFG